MTESPTTVAEDDAVYRHQTYVPLVGSVFDLHRPDGARLAVELVGVT